MIKARNLHSLSNINPLKSILIIFFEWFIIGCCFLVFNYTHKLSAIVLIPIVATRMYGLYSLLHEGVHYLLLKNKYWNDIIANIFLAFPLFTTINKVRKKHFHHHAHLKEAEDPEANQNKYKEFQFPMSKWMFLGIVIKDLTGYNFIYYYNKNMLHQKSFMKGLLLFLLVFMAFFSFLLDIKFLQLFLLCWIFPYITFFQLLNRFRLIFEHYNMENETFSTRSMIFHPIIAFFIAPYNLGYHTAHHLHPNVPFYKLKDLHYRLINNGTEIKIDRNPVKLIKNILK